jgi:hypothetical protein
MSEELDVAEGALEGDLDSEYEGDLGDGAKKKGENNEAIYIKYTA